ncbi:MAG: hypothetical protein K2U26_07125 [Cyclobacteriaceae bacterium]|nr:hypothetical protein [Cyclobacteriaceae bacterium]
MRISTWALILVMFCAACKKESGPSSAEGKWAYTTPDGKIAVTFDLVKNSSGSLDIQNPTMVVDGVSGNAVAQLSGVSLPSITSIRISANDAKLVYPYSITFANGKVSGDFKRIDVPAGEYTFPWGSVKTLTAVAIGRP